MTRCFHHTLRLAASPRVNSKMNLIGNARNHTIRLKLILQKRFNRFISLKRALLSCVLSDNEVFVENFIVFRSGQLSSEPNRLPDEGVISQRKPCAAIGAVQYKGRVVSEWKPCRNFERYGLIVFEIDTKRLLVFLIMD